MKLKTLLGSLAIMFISCGTDNTDFSGDWIDKKLEIERMVIDENGDNYIVEINEKKYPAQLIEGLLEISAELPIKATIDDNDILIISGEEYIRYENAVKPKFNGYWRITKKEDKVYDRGLSYLEIDLKNNSVKGHLNEREKNSGYVSDIIYKNISFNDSKLHLTEKMILSEFSPLEAQLEIFLINDNEIQINELNNKQEIRNITYLIKTETIPLSKVDLQRVSNRIEASGREIKGAVNVGIIKNKVYKNEELNGNVVYEIKMKKQNTVSENVIIFDVSKNKIKQKCGKYYSFKVLTKNGEIGWIDFCSLKRLRYIGSIETNGNDEKLEKYINDKNVDEQTKILRALPQ